MEPSSFDQLGLAPRILNAVEHAGYTIPTEIQSRTIPDIVAGRDVLATAQTGTGKTAAFVLPMLQRVPFAGGSGSRSEPTALILTPTRELAVQILESMHVYGKGSRLRGVAIYGGASRNRQIDQLRSHPDVIIATPGRLLDLISDGYIGLGRVTYLVLDEADRMLDMGFIPAIRQIVAMTPDERQTLLFSATMPSPIEDLARDFLKDPMRVQAESGELRVERIAQSVMFVEQVDKFKLLPELIRDRQMFRVLVFTRTKHRARKVEKLLNRDGLPSSSLHGDKSQGARMKALTDFKSSKVQVMVATDVASRGIDVDDVTHVINFELPNEPETYVHRVGRTARAGSDGEAISFCDVAEVEYLRDIEKLIGIRLEVERDQAYHRDWPEARKPQRRPSPASQSHQTQQRSSGSSSGQRSSGPSSRQGMSQHPSHSSSRNRRSRSRSGRSGAAGTTAQHSSRGSRK